MNNRLSWSCLVVLGALTATSTASAHNSWPAGRSISPIVSTSWLQQNVNRANLVILDVRSEASYVQGHIPHSVSAPFQVPFSAWITMADDLLLEVPSQGELFATLGALGITSNSWVVVVAAPNPGEPASYGFSAATRVADTLIYAGVANASVLDGGYPRWVADAGPVTTEIPAVAPTTYSGQVDSSMFVSTEYVKEHIGRASIVDARDADVYYGVTVEPWASQPGHIPSAKSLPTPWLWSSDGIFKDATVLRQMAIGATGPGRGRETIVYCGVGGYASAAWFVLTQVLGYRNVKFYDGAAQAWSKTESMTPYRWD